MAYGDGHHCGHQMVVMCSRMFCLRSMVHCILPAPPTLSITSLILIITSLILIITPLIPIILYIRSRDIRGCLLLLQEIRCRGATVHHRLRDPGSFRPRTCRNIVRHYLLVLGRGTWIFVRIQGVRS